MDLREKSSLSLCPVKVAAGRTKRKMDDNMERWMGGRTDLAAFSVKQNTGKFQSQEYLYYGLRKL